MHFAKQTRVITGKSKVCGLIGNPVAHSVSPVLHHALADYFAHDLCYVPLPVENGHLEEAVKGAYAMHFHGLNVTVPYKEQVIPFLKELDPMAKQIGAVNTLVPVEGGFKGYNTDAPGLIRALKAENVQIKDREVVVIGAGGVSRAACMILAKEGAKRIYLLNRTLSRAEELAKAVNQAVERECMIPMAMEDYEKLEGSGYLAIQATSLGMSPKDATVAIDDPAFYAKVKDGFDTVFNPLETRFMKLVKRAGGKAYNGLSMLVYQGVIAYELWNDCKVSDKFAKDLIQMLSVPLKPLNNVILVGFMGSGKSTVGQRLSYQLKRQYCDLDKLIEKREKRSISQIFAEDSEEYFRNLETATLEELWEHKSYKNAILSMGGGTPIRECNQSLMHRLGKVFYLRMSPETAFERLSRDSSRPLLQTEDPKKRITELMQEREQVYEAIADYVIDCDNLDAESVAREIAKKC